MVEYNIKPIEVVENPKLKIPFRDCSTNGRDTVIRLKYPVHVISLVCDFAQVILRNGLGVATPLVVDWETDDGHVNYVIAGHPEADEFKTIKREFGKHRKALIMQGLGEPVFLSGQRIIFCDYQLKEKFIPDPEVFKRALAYHVVSSARGEEMLLSPWENGLSNIAALKLYLTTIQGREPQ